MCIRDSFKREDKFEKILKELTEIKDILNNKIAHKSDLEISKIILEILNQLKEQVENIQKQSKIGARHLEPIKEKIEKMSGVLIEKGIIRILSEGEQRFSDLLNKLSTTKPTLSLHLKKLEANGLIEKVKAGRNVYYRLRKRILESNR